MRSFHYNRGERFRVAILLAPALMVLAALFGFGLLLGVLRSFGYSPYRNDNDWSLEHYRTVFGSDRFLSSLGFSFQIALITTILSMIIAVWAAMVLRKRFFGSRLAVFLFQTPLPVPHLVAGSAILLLFTQSGIISRLFVATGLTSVPADFPALTFDRWGIAIILSFLWKEIPFIGMVVLAVLKSIGPDYEAVAATLGASRWQRFRYVLFPLIGAPLVSSSIIVFAFAFSNYEIPLLLGSPDPAALPVFSFQLFIDPDIALRPQAMASAMVLAFSALFFLLLYRRVAHTVLA